MPLSAQAVAAVCAAALADGAAHPPEWWGPQAGFTDPPTISDTVLIWRPSPAGRGEVAEVRSMPSVGGRHALVVFEIAPGVLDAVALERAFSAFRGAWAQGPEGVDFLLFHGRGGVLCAELRQATDEQVTRLIFRSA